MAVKLDTYDPYENRDDSVVEPVRDPAPPKDPVRGGPVFHQGEEEEELSDSEDEVERTPHDRSLPLLALPLYSALPPGS